MPGGYSWSQPETIKRVDLYYNGKFETGEFDRRNRKKFFYNVTKPPCDIARKFIDLDTKDIILFHQMAGQEWKVWLMQHELKQWLKENKFGKLLNEIGFNFPKYGHVVLKKNTLTKKWEILNIQNLRNDQTSPTLEESRYVYELHRMGRTDILKMPWKKDAVETLLAEEGPYDIYECYEPGKTKKWKLTIRGRCFDYQSSGQLVHGTEANINDSNSYIEGIELDSAEVDKLPYRELKWENVPGRWLGMGYPEYLFDDQIAENEAENLERTGLYFTALHIFQTKDDTVGKNILTDVENGDILRVLSEVTPVMNEERNLPAFNATRSRWALSTERKTFTADITRGADLPSRTPLGVANLSAQQVASHYDLKREDYGMFVKDLLLDEVIPEFRKDKKKKHSVLLSSGAEGIEKYIRALAQTQVDSAAYEFAMGKGKGFFPDAEERQSEIERIVKHLSTQKGLIIDIPENYYADAEIGLDINITGEQIDTGAKNSTMMTAMQILGANPAILQNPATRTMLFKMLENAGMSPIDLNLIEDIATSQPQMDPQLGGSVSAVPAGISNPQLVPKKQML